MKKIRLDVETLSVESFATAAADPHEGTVHAHQEDSVDICASVNLCASIQICVPQQSTARRASNYASCIANCECTNGLRACIMPNTSSVC